MNKNLILISDYGSGDPAFTEVLLQLKILLPNIFIHPQSTPPFSTINTGFWIYQIAQTPNLKNTYIYSNTAPRKENKAARKNNAGEKLMYAKLKNGFEIIAVNSGYTFSFVKPFIKEFYFVEVENAGSQFRSRDKYPQAVAKMINQDKSFLGKKADIKTILDVPQNLIASIDGYGNLKTTTRSSQVKLKPGQNVVITIYGKKHLAIYTDGMFHVKEGELAFAPGSSGHDDKFMEIFLRGGSAFIQCQKPETEAKFTIEAV
jgi:S-adenosylmethionine hydrolase